MHQWNIDRFKNTSMRSRSPLMKSEANHPPSRRNFHEQLNNIEQIDSKIHGLLGMVKNRDLKTNIAKHTVSIYEDHHQNVNEHNGENRKLKISPSHNNKISPLHNNKMSPLHNNRTQKQQKPIPMHQIQNNNHGNRHKIQKYRDYLPIQLRYLKEMQLIRAEKLKNAHQYLDYAENTNNFSYLKTNHKYQRNFIPQHRNRSPLILPKPISKYIRTQNQTEASRSKNQTPIKTYPYLRQGSPLQRLRTSKQIVESSHTYLPTPQNSSQKSPKSSKNTFINQVLEINRFEIRTENEQDEKRILEESPSLQESQRSLTDYRSMERKNLIITETVEQDRGQISFKKENESLLESNKLQSEEIGERQVEQSAKLAESNQNVNKDFEIRLYPCDLDSNTIKPFIANKFVELVKVDMELDEWKTKYLQNQDPFKSKKLAKCLWDRGWRVTQDQAEQYIGVKNFEPPPKTAKTEDQSEILSLIDNLVDKFLEGEYLWDKNIEKIISQNQVKKTNFMARTLDLEKRGFLKLEDLTCFINLYASGRSKYKNRNIKNLFERFTRFQQKSTQLSYQTFMTKICGQNVKDQ